MSNSSTHPGDDRHQRAFRLMLGAHPSVSGYLCFESWEALMTFMLHSLEPAPPQPKTG